MEEILRLLEKDARYTSKQLAAMTGQEQGKVEEYLTQAEADGKIIGYTAIVDWDKVDKSSDLVTALIEVKISPQRGEGFDRIAERIYQYDEVESLYLMSGTFDLAVFISGRTMRDISSFVFGSLATIEGVTGTATHFIMKKYKEKHKIFEKQEEQEDRLLFV
ncbi:MAG: Lrp/AsnC family transcriptional regulator [Oscillospiraceae bacterium]|nr:Lrp/AsnC family transcriptional regulator [Oscillospiraceae bacterium]